MSACEHGAAPVPSRDAVCILNGGATSFLEELNERRTGRGTDYYSASERVERGCPQLSTRTNREHESMRSQCSARRLQEVRQKVPIETVNVGADTSEGWTRAAVDVADCTYALRPLSGFDSSDCRIPQSGTCYCTPSIRKVIKELSSSSTVHLVAHTYFHSIILNSPLPRTIAFRVFTWFSVLRMGRAQGT